MLEGVKEKVTKAYFLADAKRNGVKFTQAGGKLTVKLPEKAPGEIASVLCLETKR